MLKSFFHWKVWVNLLAAAVVFVGLIWLTFRWLEVHTNHGKEIPVPNIVNKSVHEAIRILDENGLDYEVDSFKYDPKYRPLQVLQIFPGPGARVKDGRTILIKVNPRTYAQVSVPDILDRYKGLAFRQLEQVGLKVGDTIYEPSIQRDAVLRMMFNGTTLKPGTLLPRFTSIDLVIGAGPRRNITIPNLVGRTVQEAKAIIAQNLFEVGLIEHEDGGSDLSDIVYYQDPAPGDVRDQGMQIDIWASKKTPAEMGNKIEQLNSMYRIPLQGPEPVYYDEAPTYNPPPQPQVITPAQEAPRTAPSRTETPPRNEPVKAPETKPKAKEETKPATDTRPKPTPKTDEKSKPRKVVVE